MATICVRNVGPLVDTGVIELRPVTLFIGKQSSGKSTLLKVLCFCRWIDKQVSIGTKINGRTVAYHYSHYMRFVREIMHFYRFNDTFFSDDSYIRYEGDGVDIIFEGDLSRNAQIITKPKGAKYNSKLCFVPSERNLLSALRNVQDAYRSSDMDMLFNFVFEWSEYRSAFTADNKLQLSVAPEMEYFYDDEKGEQIFIKHREGQTQSISPFYASSGIQSSFPLEVILKTLGEFVGRNAKMSQSYLTQIIDRILRDNSPIGDLTDVIEKSRDESRKLIAYQAIQLFVEEPEQNLFPTAQAAVIRNIVATVKKAINNPKAPGNSSSVVLTTHSPYVLSAINVLMAASEAYAKDAQGTAKVVDESLILPVGSIAAFCIGDDGCVRNIVDDSIYMIDGNYLDMVSQTVEDNIADLNRIICAD